MRGLGDRRERDEELTFVSLTAPAGENGLREAEDERDRVEAELLLWALLAQEYDDLDVLRESTESLSLS